MESFEAFLDQATNRTSNVIPGAVMAVVDKDGNYIYKKVSGTNGIIKDAEPLDFDQTFYVASCTKLITSVAALQLVEDNLITLDEPLDRHLPELSSQPIVSQTETGQLKFDRALHSITLRHLITHSSGATYDWIAPVMYKWRASRGEAPALVFDGDVLKGHTYPRCYESGTSWNYSGGLDWTSLLVERLTGVRFEDYVEDKIAKPLGLSSFTWHLSHKPRVAEKLARMSTRKENGNLTDGPNPFSPEPAKEAGGIGMYANVHDYTRVLADLLREAPTLLKKASVDQMFASQLAPGSSALHDLRANGETVYQCSLDNSMEGVVANYGLGGLLVEEDVKRANYFRPAGTLSWFGLPNLSWSINRDRGLATFFATQVVPWADRKTWDVIARFETAVWTNLAV
ncbi:beta-lactamase [Stagonosporopsis vannaccii]|nr:beta-lactamase [Stagonosporopsis vannaccii]